MLLAGCLCQTWSGENALKYIIFMPSSGGELWPKQQSDQDVVQFLFGIFHGDEFVPFQRSVTVKLAGSSLNSCYPNKGWVRVQGG